MSVEVECVRCDALRTSHTASVLGPAMGYQPDEMETFYRIIHIQNNHEDGVHAQLDGNRMGDSIQPAQLDAR